MRTITLVAGVLILALAWTIGAFGAAQEGGYIKVEVKGQLKTGIVAIGGETTGTTITTPNGTLELDFGKSKELKDQAAKLDGKTVIATGTLTMRKGVAIKQRHIVLVDKLKAAE